MSTPHSPMPLPGAIAALHAARRSDDVVVILFANGVYEVTGAQPIPGAATARSTGTNVDFVGIARASGFRAVFRFSQLAEWTAELPKVLDAPGPVFAVVEVAPVPGAPGPRSPGPAAARARTFMAALRGA
jgi:sulfopyruvate decarboxylase subunit beta